jgi:cell division protein FtsW
MALLHHAAAGGGGDLVPTKGIPLPLISSGGTSLFCTLASIGILLNITKKVE